MPVGYRFIVKGLVQNVGFRFFVKTVADGECIKGFVHNISNGSVETVAVGERKAVERFELAIKSGPIGARVDSVELKIISVIGYANFVITE